MRARPMSELVQLKPQAASDIDDIAEQLRQEAGLSVGMRFLRNADESFRILAERSRIGATLEFWETTPEIRRWHIEGFANYMILYRRIDEGIEIIRVLPGARDIEACLDVIL
jgi:toxin ParE1/3/4